MLDRCKGGPTILWLAAALTLANSRGRGLRIFSLAVGPDEAAFAHRIVGTVAHRIVGPDVSQQEIGLYLLFSVGSCLPVRLTGDSTHFLNGFPPTSLSRLIGLKIIWR